MNLAEKLRTVGAVQCHVDDANHTSGSAHPRPDLIPLHSGSYEEPGRALRASGGGTRTTQDLVLTIIPVPLDRSAYLENVWQLRRRAHIIAQNANRYPSSPSRWTRSERDDKAC